MAAELRLALLHGLHRPLQDEREHGRLLAADGALGVLGEAATPLAADA